MLDFERKIDERKLNACHVFMATMLGKLAEKGFLNQGALNILMPEIAKKLSIYLKHKYGEFKSDNPEELIKEIIEKLIIELDPFIDYKIEINDSKITIAINSSTCKFCPKGVGEAEIPGILCSFPQLFKEIISNIMGKTLNFSFPNRLVKKSGYCIIQFSAEL